MYDIEMREATKLIDDTKRDAAAALMKTQKAEQDVARQKDRYNQLSGGRDAYRKEISALEQQIAENEAVRFPLRIKDIQLNLILSYTFVRIFNPIDE